MTTNAKNLVSDEMVHKACRAYENSNIDEYGFSGTPSVRPMRAALEAIAPMLAQAGDVATDGGRNPHYEGCFEGETQEQADERRYSAHAITPNDLVEVKRSDANKYCIILRVLGMEEEGDPVAWVKDQLAQAGEAK